MQAKVHNPEIPGSLYTNEAEMEKGKKPVQKVEPKKPTVEPKGK